MIIVLVACERDDDSVTKARAANMSSAAPHPSGRGFIPTGTEGGRNTLQVCGSASCLVASQDEIFSLRVSLTTQISFTCDLEALLLALDICHSVREQSCCHNTLPDFMFQGNRPDAPCRCTQKCWCMCCWLFDLRVYAFSGIGA